MKTFKDLRFTAHPAIMMGFHTQARMDFENGYGVSVVTGSSAYCGMDTYEVAIMKNGDLCYSTDITDDVLGYQTPDEITDVMIKLQSLKP